MAWQRPGNKPLSEPMIISLLMHICIITLHWRHNDHDGISNHQPHCVYLAVYSDADQRKHQSSGAGEFPAQRASYTENVSIWWRHHVTQPQWVKNHRKQWLLMFCYIFETFYEKPVYEKIWSLSLHLVHPVLSVGPGYQVLIYVRLLTSDI